MNSVNPLSRIFSRLGGIHGSRQMPKQAVKSICIPDTNYDYELRIDEHDRMPHEYGALVWRRTGAPGRV